ncbi:MAG: thiamine phosphate synthase [Methylacidiphilales bacterium]|nr:thiamine phosphate synthase [Candidatus Methylacidiphilales bacterium]
MTRNELLERLAAARLYAILDAAYSDPARWPDLAAKIIRGGAGVIQVRAKKASASQVLEWAQSIRNITRENKVPLIINDHPGIVRICDADGCHVGQDDLPLEQVRALIGPEKVAGKSTHSLEQALAAREDGADYIGFGPIFATPTKPDYAPIGAEIIRAMSGQISVPAFCIGGIKKENVAQLKELGAQRVVIVSGLLQAGDPESYARDVLERLK